ncbi:hypothetical protein PMAYCL1PPCAC_01657, partial [Pristionchus mayeri]
RMALEIPPNDRIFYKDLYQDELKGPFTEREMQEWYRKKLVENASLPGNSFLFEGDFPFYFMTGDNSPDVSTPSYTLNELCTFNGSGAPFRVPSEVAPAERTRAHAEQKVRRLQEEISKLSVMYGDVLRVKQRLGQVTDVSMTMDCSLEDDREEIVLTLDMLGESVASYILDSLAVYASGDFASWDAQAQTKRLVHFYLVTQQEQGADFYRAIVGIIVEKMKEKEVFYCSLCEEALLNYKQALLHFHRADHEQNEKRELGDSTAIAFYRSLISAISRLPFVIAHDEIQREESRIDRYGHAGQGGKRLRPTPEFISMFCAKYDPLQDYECTAPVLSEVAFIEFSFNWAKGDIGRKAMKELHDYLGKGQTCCTECGYNTGNREGFYSHLTSYVHAKNGITSNSSMFFDNLALIVNAQRKDLI